MWATELSATWAPKPGRLSASALSSRLAPGTDAWTDPTLHVVHRQDPSPGPNEVVVKVAVCGICGSDTHCIETDSQGYLRFSGPMRLPCVLGHELTGEVVAVGSAVRGLRVGHLVAAEGMLYCGACEACKRGRFNQCSDLDMLGFSAPGGLAELVCLNQRHLWSLDPLAEALGSADKALRLGALVEPISCAFNGIWVSSGGMLPGAHVAVYGCGPIGLGAIALCRAAGAAQIIAFDTVPERVALALRCGASTAVVVDEGAGPGARPRDVVTEATRGWGADLHIEAAGAGTHTVPEMMASLAPGATVLYLGRTGESIPLGMDALVSGAARVVGSRGHAGGGCYPNLLRMMAAGALDPSAMITTTMPLHQAPAALDRSRSRTDGKILLIAER